MVRGRVDRRHPIRSRGQSASHVDANRPVHSRSIDTLEERELGRVRGRRLGERVELFDDDMCVSDDVALGVDLLGSGVVVRGRVDEVTGLEVRDGHGDGEVLVGGDRVEVLRVREFT